MQQSSTLILRLSHKKDSVDEFHVRSSSTIGQIIYLYLKKYHMQNLFHMTNLISSSGCIYHKSKTVDECLISHFDHLWIK